MKTTSTEPLDRLTITGRIRAALDGIMDIERYAWDERGTLTLRGQLSGPPYERYRSIRTHFEALGFTPFLRRADGADELFAVPIVIQRRPARIWLPILLFLITIVTVVMTGALNERTETITSLTDLLRLELTILTTPSALRSGLPFAATLLGILFTHEMGHYIVGRIRKAPVSLPYFIPIPPGISFTGTMGAVIVQQEPMQDRRTVLEVGIAGPLAGLAVAIPLLLYGLATSSLGPTASNGALQEGNSLLYIAAKWLVFGRYLPAGNSDVQLNAVAFGAWIGLLVTMLNLLPVGQLDGGHVAYALLGHRAHYLAYAMFGVCLVLGILVSSSWLIWAVMILLIGLRHPAPLDDISPLSRAHIALAIFGLLVFVLLLMPAPLTIVGA